jgi:transposase
MSRRKKDPLREPTDSERQGLIQLSRSQAAPAVEVIRAKLLLAVAAGDDQQDAARAVGRRPGDAVSHLVARFNAEGLAAPTPRHGGGRRPTYGPEARARIAAEAARAPTPETDGTATWSLSALQRTLRAAPDGLPKVSTDTIRRALHESGSSYQRTRTWCPTGKAPRRRKAGPDGPSTRIPIGGWFAQAGYILTGVTIRDRTLIEPLRPFDLRTGRFGLGAFEITGRYSLLDLDHRVFAAGLVNPDLWTNRAEMTDIGFN